MKITRLPSGSFRAEAYLGKDETGKRIRKVFTGTDKKRLQLDVAAYLDTHRDKLSSDSLKAAMTAYIASREAVLSGSTIRAYISIEKGLNERVPELVRKPACSISSEDIQDAVSVLSALLSPKSLRNYMNFISAVLKFKQVSMPFVRLPERVRPDLHIPDEVTMARVLKLVHGDPLEVPVLLAATGPLRRGEICALSMCDIDGNVIHVRRDMVMNKYYRWELRPPKNLSSDRYIEMPKYVMSIIRDQGYVTNLNPNNISDRFQAFLKRNDIPPFRFHDIRHYCVSMLKARNVPDIYIQQRGGWSTDNVMKNVYTHTLQNQSKIQTEKMIGYFNEMLM